MLFKRHILRWALLLPIAVVAFMLLQYQHAGMLLHYGDQVQQRALLVPYAEVNTRMGQYKQYAEIESRLGTHPGISKSKLYPNVGWDHVWFDQHGLLLLDDWSRVRITAKTLENQYDFEDRHQLADAIIQQQDIKHLVLMSVLLKPELVGALSEIDLKLFTYSIRDVDEMHSYKDQLWMGLPSAEIVQVNRCSLYPSNRHSQTVFYSDALRFVVAPETKVMLLAPIYAKSVTIEYLGDRTDDRLDCYISQSIWSFTRTFDLSANHVNVYTIKSHEGEVSRIMHQEQGGFYRLLEEEAEQYRKFRSNLQIGAPTIKRKKRPVE